MNIKSAIILFLIASSSALAQSHTPIKGSQNVRLADPVQKAVAIGGVKDDLVCDSSGAIYTSANRGYSSAYNAVVRIAPDGKQFTRYSIDDVEHLREGHIAAFEVAENGVFVLAREVKKYNDVSVPVVFGATYIVHFDPNGKVIDEVRLEHDFGDVTPTGITRIQGTNLLILGYEYDKATKRLREFAYTFSDTGALKSQITLTPEGTQASNTTSISSMSVLSPTAVKADGRIFVLRGSTRDPVFVFSNNGTLERKITFQIPEMEFSSPKIIGDRLVVHKHRPAPESGGARVVMEPELDAYPVFDLKTGMETDQYEWRQHGALACIDEDGLTMVLQDVDCCSDSHWAIIKAKPAHLASPTVPPLPMTAGVSLQVRWIVPCSEGSEPVVLRGDEAARKYCLSQDIIVSDTDIAAASAYTDLLGQPGMLLKFTQSGSNKIQRATDSAKMSEIGVVINGELVFKATVMEPLEHEAIITVPSIKKSELQSWIDRLNMQAKQRVQHKVARVRGCKPSLPNKCLSPVNSAHITIPRKIFSALGI